MGASRGTMDFFAAQEAARRRTLVLVALFVLAIVLTVVLADIGIAMVLSGSGRHVGRGVSYLAEQDPTGGQGWWSRFDDLLLPVTGAVLAIVAVGYAWHALRLAGDGGDAVARMMGGRPVDRLSQEPGERRAVNVLEEMALAAAIPVPRLYVMDAETGINAFAAGTSPDQAVVAVTRGTLDQLTRDELQGVFAHELSHVLNADMRLNLRLMTAVGGLTALALVGRMLLSSQRTRGWTSSRRRSGGGAIVGIGLALLVAGGIGVFFARLIRLAVSRQREFLADAAAVQFTRNPGGLSGALAKISEQGSALAAPHAPEAAHLFFANGVGGFFSGFLSTHPPLEERIRRIGAAPGPARAPSRPAPAAAPSPSDRAAQVAAVLPTIAVGAAAAASVGRPSPEHLQAAAAALAGFPPALADAARRPSSARAVALALLLDADAQVRARQLATIAGGTELREAVLRLATHVDAVPRRDRLALLDLALPALDGLSAEEARALLNDLSALADADQRLTLHEWALQRLVRRRLAPRLGSPPPAVRARTLEQVQVEALELLSAIAWTGQREPAAAQAALDAGVQAMEAGAWRVLPRDRFTAAGLDTVLTRLDESSPPLKAQLLAGAAVTALADGRVTVAESELLRAVAGSLGLPMPELPGTEEPASAAQG